MVKLSTLLRSIALLILTATLVCVTPNNANLANYNAFATSGEGDMYINAFESHIKRLYYDCNLHNKNLDYHIFKYAVTGYYNLKREGGLPKHKHTLTIVDYNKASQDKRLYVIDMLNRYVTHHTYVAHGKNSGLMYARNFSNQPESKQSSLGFYKTGDTYYGNHGYSLRLIGQEIDFNSKALQRCIVMHSANYVSAAYANRHGSLGTSWGCPAIPPEENHAIINKIKHGGCLFVYANNIYYLNESQYLNMYPAARFYAQNSL